MNIHVWCNPDRRYDLVRYSHKLHLICKEKLISMYNHTYTWNGKIQMRIKAPKGMEYIESSFRERQGYTDEYLYMLIEYSDGSIKFVSPKAITIYELRRSK